MINRNIEEGKTMAIISYITLIGLIIAFVMNNDKRNSFASFHIRQNVGIFGLYFVNIFLFSRFVDPSILFLIGLGTFVLWVIGLIGALRGKEKSVPLFGDLFQDWFKSIS